MVEKLIMTSALPPTESNANAVVRKMSIICVDDSPEMLLICRTILEASGFQVFTAESGEAALALMEEHSVDAAVIDNVMPGMNGVELARRIKQAHDDVPILMFSDSGPSPVCAAIDYFLNKQSGPRAMRNAVRSLLQRRPG